MTNSPDGGAVLAASIAAVLATASAAVSAYWALGGTALLDTVGGDIEQWGRERSAGVLLALWAIVAVKLAGAALALVLAGVGGRRLPAWTRGRRARALGWTAAVGLTLYGTVLTTAGLLVTTGVLDAADDVDQRALTWHTFLWDPWFALWGAAFTVAMWRSRHRHGGSLRR